MKLHEFIDKVVEQLKDIQHGYENSDVCFSHCTMSFFIGCNGKPMFGEIKIHAYNDDEIKCQVREFEEFVPVEANPELIIPPYNAKVPE